MVELSGAFLGTLTKYNAALFSTQQGVNSQILKAARVEEAADTNCFRKVPIDSNTRGTECSLENCRERRGFPDATEAEGS